MRLASSRGVMPLGTHLSTACLSSGLVSVASRLIRVIPLLLHLFALLAVEAVRRTEVRSILHPLEGVGCLAAHRVVLALGRFGLPIAMHA